MLLVISAQTAEASSGGNMGMVGGRSVFWKKNI